MRRFTDLALALDAAQTAEERHAALVAYFTAAPAADAAHARRLLTGDAPPRVVSPRQLRRWVAEATGVAEWLVGECREVTGDLAEAAALLLAPAPASPLPLATWIADRLEPLAERPARGRRAAVVAAWTELDRDQRWLWNRLLLGTYRPRLAAAVLARAAAAAAGEADPLPTTGAATAEHRVDAVLLYAQRGRGALVSFYCDYTFGVWVGDDLVPLARLPADPDDEMALHRVDRHVRRHATERFGPVRAVAPALVATIAFAGVRAASRRKSGVELAAPRLVAWRPGADPAAAGRLADVTALLDLD